MATKTFNDICVEYAHQLGKGLPLTAPEMCNAVIMYLNAQITEMQGITTALQTAVTEAEASATEATNTANELSGKVDTLQTNVTEAEANATEALNKSNDVAETVNALPKVPTPTTSDNGKVIGVQSGTYTLVEQSGGEAPANMVTTDTEQTIYGYKNFVNDIGVTSGSNIRMSVLTIANDGVYYYNTTINFPNKGSTETTFATTDDIPDFDNYIGTVHIVQGTAGSGIAVHDTANTSPYTKYGYDKIVTYGNANALLYTLNIPNKNGTIATLDDIGSSSDTKYFTRVIFNDSNTHYIFSCITNDDLSGNNVYGDVVSLLTELGATSPYSALPCSGKTDSGNAVIGVYTAGSEITVFGGDNEIEVIPTSAEINIISK